MGDSGEHNRAKCLIARIVPRGLSHSRPVLTSNETRSPIRLTLPPGDHHLLIWLLICPNSLSGVPLRKRTCAIPPTSRPSGGEKLRGIAAGRDRANAIAHVS